MFMPANSFSLFTIQPRYSINAYNDRPGLLFNKVLGIVAVISTQFYSTKKLTD